MRTDDELRKAIAEHYWFHSIELRPGIITPGNSAADFTLTHIGLPRDMSGMSVLDIGCWDGFHSFECERRGAARVVASDIWESAGRGAFDLAREELGSKVHPLQASVHDLPVLLGGERFDLVLFLGVLYHLRDPLGGVEKMAACVRPGGVAITESLTDVTHLHDPPLMAFHPDGVDGDLTTWWSPNIAAVSSMLKVAGFSDVVSTVQCYAGNRTVLHARKGTDEYLAERARLDRAARYSFRKPAETVLRKVAGKPVDQPPAEAPA